MNVLISPARSSVQYHVFFHIYYCLGRGSREINLLPRAVALSSRNCTSSYQDFGAHVIKKNILLYFILTSRDERNKMLVPLSFDRFALLLYDVSQDSS